MICLVSTSNDSTTQLMLNLLIQLSFFLVVLRFNWIPSIQMMELTFPYFLLPRLSLLLPVVIVETLILMSHLVRQLLSKVDASLWQNWQSIINIVIVIVILLRIVIFLFLLFFNYSIFLYWVEFFNVLLALLKSLISLVKKPDAIHCISHLGIAKTIWTVLLLICPVSICVTFRRN
jgi:hypothetical protein